MEYGEIKQLGQHFLMCGDSSNIEDVNKLLYTAFGGGENGLI